MPVCSQISTCACVLDVRKAVQVVRAKMQQIVVTEFLPALGIDPRELRQHKPKINRPDVAIEFSIAYRFGHDIIPDNVRALSAWLPAAPCILRATICQTRQFVCKCSDLLTFKRNSTQLQCTLHVACIQPEPLRGARMQATHPAATPRRGGAPGCILRQLMPHSPYVQIGEFSVTELFSSEAFYGVSSNAGVADPFAANDKLDALMKARRCLSSGNLLAHLRLR